MSKTTNNVNPGKLIVITGDKLYVNHYLIKEIAQQLSMELLDHTFVRYSIPLPAISETLKTQLVCISIMSSYSIEKELAYIQHLLESGVSVIVNLLSVVPPAWLQYRADFEIAVTLITHELNEIHFTTTVIRNHNRCGGITETFVYKEGVLSTCPTLTVVNGGQTLNRKTPPTDHANMDVLFNWLGETITKIGFRMRMFKRGEQFVLGIFSPSANINLTLTNELAPNSAIPLFTLFTVDESTYHHGYSVIFSTNHRYECISKDQEIKTIHAIAGNEIAGRLWIRFSPDIKATIETLDAIVNNPIAKATHAGILQALSSDSGTHH